MVLVRTLVGMWVGVNVCILLTLVGVIVGNINGDSFDPFVNLILKFNL